MTAATPAGIHVPCMTYDIAVVGLGAVGAAATMQLTRSGARVIGFDRYDPPHSFGSSGGGTRITRLAIGEGDHLTPLAVRSHELWREIERQSGASLLTACGGLVISSDKTIAETHVKGFFRRTLAAAETFGIPHEVLDAAQIRSRFPQFAVQDDELGYFEPSAGFLRPEACIRAQLELAANHGADLHLAEEVLRFAPASGGVAIETARGRYAAGRVIVAAGAWLPGLLDRKLASLFKIHRQVMLWFDVAENYERFTPGRFPVFIWEPQNTQQGLYGFPAIDGPYGGMKVASEQFVEPTSADSVARDVSSEEIAYVYDTLVRPHFRGVGAQCIQGKTCLYTVTPDSGFVIDTHPDSER
ncbi:MAG TPA: N-methyl-L-tryptophan oxidase, partial [Rhizomicrobium sp.]